MLKPPFQLSQYQNDINEILLADIAVKIQLTPSEYELAKTRAEKIEAWLEREGSPLRGLVVRIYPQGSMAINATISSAQDKEIFDIDLVVELRIPKGSGPEEVLDLLFEAVRGKKGSRYYNMTERNSRCVTIHFSTMSLDLSPAVLMPELPERTSTMFHHSRETGESYWHIRNPKGFADWYLDGLEDEPDFGSFYQGRGLIMLRAETEPVPEPIPIYQKSRKTVGVQLIKRFRNNRFEKRPHKGPPSVILTKLAKDAGHSFGGIYDELVAQAVFLDQMLCEQPLKVVNPSCPEHDILTDRWPGGAAKQREFYLDVRHLQARLVELKTAKELRQKQVILADLFGERATAEAFNSLQKKYSELASEGKVPVNPATAGIALGVSGIAGAGAMARPTACVPRHHSHSS